MAVIRAVYTSPIRAYIVRPQITIRFRLLRDGEATPGTKYLRATRGVTSLGTALLAFVTDSGGEFTQACSVDLANFLAQGDWLFLGSDDQLPRRVRVSYISIAESGTYTFNITEPFDLYTLGGSGYLAGSFPGGITTVDGVPTAATVRVLYRPGPGQPGDGALVAEVQSAADGSWRVDGLDPALKFDVVGRKAWFNDVIMSNVSPKVD